MLNVFLCVFVDPLSKSCLLVFFLCVICVIVVIFIVVIEDGFVVAVG